MRKAALYFVMFLLVFVSHLTIPASLSAQALGSSGIEGTVMDSSGAVILGASVTIRNVATGASRTVTADSSGHYRMLLLQPGDYEVTAQQSGFTTVRRTGIRLEVGATATVDLELRVAAVAETVTVTAEAPITEPERTEYSATVGEKSVENLPINGRRWENFVLLTPGVVPDGTFGLVSYRGVSGLYNNNQVDGADNNQAFFSEARGRTRAAYTISQAAIKEFQVGLSNFTAESGRAAGGSVNAVTKSGTNDFHGEAFWYIRDDAIQAQEPFQPSKPPDRRQQYGVSLGFPLVKDKLFFFGNFDQQLRHNNYFVKPASSSFLTGTCSAPGCASTIAFFNSLQVFVPRGLLNNVAFGKVDWVLSPKHTLIGQYNWHRWKSPNGIRTAPIQFNAESDNGFDGVKTDMLLFRLNSVLTPTLFNEGRFQYGRDFEFQTPNATGPSTSISNGISFGMPNFLPRPAFPNEKRFQWTDNLSWVKGRHALKFGADINYVRERQINLFQGGGIYSYSTINDIASDCPTAATGCVPRADGTRTGKHYSNFNHAFDNTGQSGRVFFTTTDYNWYVQDTIRASSGLTLNLGMRYEYQKLPQPEPVTISGQTATGNPAFPLTQSFNQDTNNLAPRVGIAWDIRNRHKTVIRAGYGIHYGRTSNSALSSARTNNGRLFVSFFFTPTTSGSPVYPNCFTPAINSPSCTLPTPTGTGSRPDIQFLAADYARPIIHESELSIERQLFANTSVSVSYLYSRGQRLPLFRDINLLQPSDTLLFVAPDGTFGAFPLFTGSRPTTTAGRLTVSESVINSKYNAFVLRVDQRLSHGILFSGHFTVSKALDNGQGSTTFFGGNDPLNPFDRRNDNGLSTFDTRKRFVLSFFWDPAGTWDIQNPAGRVLVKGFKFSGIVTLQDGRPLTGNLSGNLPSALFAVDAQGLVTGRTSFSTTAGGINGSGGSRRLPWLARNSATSTGLATVDFRVTRDFRVTESKKIAVVWEAFNLFNRTNFASFGTSQLNISCATVPTTLPAGQIGAPPPAGACLRLPDGKTQINTITDAGFLVPTAASATLFGPRDMQFAVKFIW